MKNEVDAICQELRIILDGAVKRNLASAILLSGGLDTSILAALASKYTSLEALTGAVASANAPDVPYAKLIASKLGLKHCIHHFDERDIYQAIPFVIKTLRSFDPMQIRSGITLFICLQKLKASGINAFISGDGADELFAGYPQFLAMNREQIKAELVRFLDGMNRVRFISTEIAEALEMQVKLPYLDSEFRSFAAEIKPDFKVRREGELLWGKWILRKAFEGIIPSEIAWRMKTPIELGSGTALLIYMLNSKLSDWEFNEKKQRCLRRDKVLIRSREQLYYYEIYRTSIGIPHPVDEDGAICKYCNSNIDSWSRYCRTCGGYN